MTSEVKIQLTSVSPVSFSVAKEGDRARIEHKPPRRNEYREKIGPPTDCYLVFKGQTKIGMIPKDFVDSHKDLLRRRVCLIKEMNPQKSLVVISFSPTSLS